MYVNNMNAINLVSSNGAKLSFLEADTCPICKTKLSPKFLSAIVYKKNDVHHASVINYCSGCESVFITNYLAQMTTSGNPEIYSAKIILSSEPNHFEPFNFDEFINKTSPQFTKIYNQALAAESYGLTDIAGLGYRKSLEFLVKDYLILLNPDNEQDIKSCFLGKCIKDYIDNPQIKVLVERSTWIGNDEAHYIRKQEDRDISDMKNFIKATVYFISMVLISQDAETIEPK